MLTTKRTTSVLSILLAAFLTALITWISVKAVSSDKICRYARSAVIISLEEQRLGDANLTNSEPQDPYLRKQWWDILVQAERKGNYHYRLCIDLFKPKIPLVGPSGTSR